MHHRLSNCFEDEDDAMNAVSRALAFKDLKGKGIPFHRVSVNRLVKEGKFPKPFKLGATQNAWFEHVIDGYLLACSQGRAEEFVAALDQAQKNAA
jgi:predicted DNA-binding transcriptional regulator AlpA